MNQKKEIFDVRGMDCVSCSLTIEKALKKVPGVRSAAVNAVTNKAVIEYDSPAAPEILAKAVKDVGYTLVVSDTADPHAGHRMKTEDGSFGKAQDKEHDHSKILGQSEVALLKKKLWLG